MDTLSEYGLKCLTIHQYKEGIREGKNAATKMAAINLLEQGFGPVQVSELLESTVQKIAKIERTWIAAKRFSEKSSDN